MKRLLFLFIILTCFSCTKKIVQLPETTNQDITELLDVSPVYMFYDEENDSIEFNRKNMISTTNWLVNIDKRLTLKQILPHLQYLQDKRHGDGMHKNENAGNYFTCNNSDLKNLSFIEFTEVKYDGTNDKSNKDHNNSKQQINIDFISPDKIKMNFISDVYSFHIDSNIKNLSFDIISRLISHGEIFITSSLKKDLSFQDYINFKTILSQLEYDKITINNNEFIY